MIFKVKDGCVIELKEIKMVKTIEYNQVEISYYDEKKNPKAYIGCDSEEETIQIVDKIMEAIKNKPSVARIY